MAETTRVTFETCAAEWDGATLVVSNDCIRRTWRLVDGCLHAEAIVHLPSEHSWLSAPSDRPALTPPVSLPDASAHYVLSRIDTPESPVEAESLKVCLQGALPNGAVTWTFQVFPGVPAVTAGLGFRLTGTAVRPAGRASEPSAPDVERTGEDAPPEAGAGSLDVVEALTLAPQHLRLIEVTMEDRTDFHNELVFEREWLLHTAENNLALKGGLFVFEETLTGRGLALLKHAPLPAERPVPCDRDLLVNGKDRTVTLFGHGIPPEGGDGYATALLCYEGGAAGRTRALRRLQRALRPYVPARDGLLLCNTWGDRSQDSRVNEPFMRQEIAAGARLGVEIVQIDDGWQKGRSTNSAQGGGIREGFWDTDPEYWSPHPERFPNGFAALVAEAREAGMQFGLWFWPDNADDLANWERDANAIIGLHREYGINYFKIDGVTVRSWAGERNLHRFFRTVQRETGGNVVFDLDITAGVRPGYFGAANVGPLFVENRYTDWHRYWPHQTLRNLWKLARYVDPVRLRFEFLNHTRNTHLYPDDPLGPSAYRPDGLFATVMMCSPLAWFEASNLPDGYIEQAAPLVRTWRAHRERLFGGTVVPIGAAPDGVAWTGFASVSDAGGGYLLLFRERNPKAVWESPMSLFAEADHRVELLGGRGSVELGGGVLHAEIPEPLDFVFVRLDAA